MSTKIRGLLPRVALRIKDSATGSYPSNVRTGDDSRTGEYNVFFNDEDTIVYNQFPDRILQLRSGAIDPIYDTLLAPSATNDRQLLFGKRDPHFNLGQDRGFYTSSGIRGFWQFNSENIINIDGDIAYLTSSAGSSNATLTGTWIVPESHVIDSDKPRTGSAGSIQGWTTTRPFWKVEESGPLGSFVFGDASQDSPFSIACWVNVADFQYSVESTNTGLWFVSKQGTLGPGQAEYAFGIRGDHDGSSVTKARQPDASGSLFLRLYDSSATSSFEARTNLTQVSVQPNHPRDIIDSGFRHPRSNEWMHVAVTYNGDGSDPGSDITFYINGVTVHPDTGTIVGTYTAMEDTGTPVYLGSRSESAGGEATSPFVGGKMADVAIFAGELSPLEVRELYGYRYGLNMPSGLPANSRFLTEDIRTDIFVPQTVTKGVFDNFVSFTPGQHITPFNETFRPEQSRETSFYLTGTDPAESSIGFSSKLASKTQIKFEFNIGTASAMVANSASIVYFNKDSGQFDLAGGREATSEPAANEERGMSGRDCKLFNAIGMAIMSGTGISGSGQSPPSPFHGNSWMSGTTGVSIDSDMDKALIFKQPQSVLLNPLFSASIPQRISMSGVIKHPFLLEKAVIELPISSSDGWFNDQTLCLSDGTLTFSDVGGPCVTVSLMNQLASRKRELICSSTIIPNGDNVSFTRQGQDSILGPAGFTSFATPGVVVSESGIQKLTLEIQPAISNGVISVTSGGIDFNDAFIGEVSPFCRSFDASDPSARSYFGKEYAIPRFENALATRYDETIFSGSAHSDLFIFEKQEVSPYVLLPTDELILAVSKYRAAMTSILSRNPVTSSHEFGFPTGTIKMTLYGSLIKNNQEFHDTLNQNLTSDAVHEFIHFDNPVVDQFDIEGRSSFSGSYIAQFFTGSMIISGTYNTGTFFGNGFLDQRRGVRSSIIGTSNALADNLPVFFGNADFRIGKPGFNRAVTLVSENERYFDTLLPRPDQISNIHGADILHDTSLNRNFYLLGRGSGLIAAEWIESWDMLFPFEARYASVTRTTSPFRDVLSTQSTALSPLVLASSEAGLYRPESVNNTAGTINSARIMHGAFISTSFLSYLPIPNRILAKAMFTIGDGQYNEPIGTSLNAGGAVAYDVLPRGFKYGLMNANPEKKKWKWRRDHYGQFRDMLEQARDAKIYLEDKQSIIGSPVVIKFVDASGSAVEPEDTFSSNMSTEATSSLPYFDDIGRNRGALPSVVAI